MTNYNFNSIKFNLEYGLGGKPVSRGLFQFYLNPEKPDVPLNKNDAFQKVQKRRVQEKR